MMSEHTDPEEIAVPLFEEQDLIAKRRIVLQGESINGHS